MGKASSSSSAATGINAPGGSINSNSPGLWAMALAAIVALFFIFRRRKK